VKEAARVAAIAKFAAKTGGNYELAERLVEAVYKVFPPPGVLFLSGPAAGISIRRSARNLKSRNSRFS
jgi:hypothetical protein